ncbi:hypothetical protein A4H97_23920 [Niastella yeongjuensis]|uniref:Uncharacterized protein n=1 Tax=Niastella yeongjuensis TaxID=354355 RepID=A0A1V9F3A8_9BACT|nr:hypothetical protein [Niastella yeongjuensis]OQP52757.1 hypothetical protein A4H97_23920 [Niastella yeongjuensis]SEP18999.1 hypothetical protein SAMN05660816_04671 [Niastella yeongjuensis]
MLSETIVELLDPNWTEMVSQGTNVKFMLNGIMISDSRAKLESVLNDKEVNYKIFYPLVNEVNKRTYECDGYKFNLVDDTVVGFALTYTELDSEYVKKCLGETDQEIAITGEVYSMYDWQLLGYNWKYNRLNLEISIDKEKLIANTFYVGKNVSS